MNKSYCDKCKKIDKDCKALVEIRVGNVYHNERGVPEGVLDEKDFLKRIMRFSKDLTLCGNCFMDFFNHVNKVTPNK